MIEFLNELFALLYEPFFDYSINNDLLDCVFNNFDYAKIGGILIITPLLFLLVFYKIWDPIKNPKLKWILTIIIIALISAILTHTILIKFNNCLRIIIGGYSGSGADPFNFVLITSLISFFYGLIIAFLLSIIPFRLISTNNRYNPF
jgi:succinate dehydrogenase hydrophobic anchor subunit